MHLKTISPAHMLHQKIATFLGENYLKSSKRSKHIIKIILVMKFVEESV